MKVTVIGGGAMGGLFACLLSEHADVTLIDTDKELINEINSNGFSLIMLDGTERIFRLKAAGSTEGMDKQDLIILFVKSMFSTAALDSARSIIDKNTFIMSMQNGMGHEEVLKRYADDDHVIIGTTQHNAAVLSKGHNRHNGKGPNSICNVSKNTALIEPIAALLTESGLDASISTDVRRMIWNKLFTNISASILTGILQTRLGYIAENDDAWKLCRELIREGCEVARADGFEFDTDEKTEEVRKVCTNTPNGMTSICFDLSKGKRTEVDTISGAVLRLAEKYGVSVPYTRMAVGIVHAMEGRNRG